MKYLVSMLPVISIVSSIGSFMAGRIAQGVLAIVLTVLYAGIVTVVWVGEHDAKKLNSQKGA